MNEAGKGKDDQESGAQFEKSIEKKCEAWGNSADKKADALMKQLPLPVKAILDTVCMTIIFAGISWVLVRTGRLDGMPSLKMFGLLAGAIFVVGLVYRLVFKRGK